MRIIIAGAGSVGYHLAQLLSIESNDITIIDQDEDVLAHVASKLDVLTIHGNATSIDVLTEAKVKQASLFLAVTTSEEANLLIALLAKQKGTKFTIARVKNPEFLRQSTKDYFSKIGIDHIFSPHQLAAREISRLIKRASFTDTFDFENGKISVVGFSIDNESNLVGETIKGLGDKIKINHRAVALLRNHETRIPSSSEVLQQGDHLYLSLKRKDSAKIEPFLGKQIKPIKNIMITGNSDVALRSAEALQKDYNVKILLKDKSRAKSFLSLLDKSLVIVGDPANIDLLKEEGLESMDAFIGLTNNAETNILTSLLAEEIGVYKTIALVNNDNYTHISQNIGIDTIINKKIIAANNVFRFVRKGRVEAIATLHGVNAEIIEFVIGPNQKICLKPLGELSLPKKSRVAGVIRSDKSIIPDRNFIFKENDRCIIFALPDAIPKVENIFSSAY